MPKLGRSIIEGPLGAAGAAAGQKASRPPPLAMPPAWTIPLEDLSFDLDEKGQPVLLGNGSYGQVFRGTLRGVRRWVLLLLPSAALPAYPLLRPSNHPLHITLAARRVAIKKVMDANGTVANVFVREVNM